MIQWLVKQKELYQRKSRFDERYKLRLDWWNKLLSDEASAKKIRSWLKSDFKYHEEWEYSLFLLSQCFADFSNISNWEATPAENRNKHANRVVLHATKLADALEEDGRPNYPSIFDLLPHEGNGLHSLFSLSGSGIINPDALPNMLRQLAKFAETTKNERKRDARPNIPGNNARAFSRELDKFFERYFDYGYGSMPNDILAECVSLKFPDIGTPGEDTIRKWRNAK